MNIEEYREYCLAKPGVTEELPFGPDTLVFKVMGKMFSASGIDQFERFNVKCDPEYAIELRATYQGVIPGWHMNKKHWNTVYTNSDVPYKVLQELIDHSYDLVASSLKKTEKAALKKMS